jgi:5-methylcytosine-specific restriction endonuclease McrA
MARFRQPCLDCGTPTFGGSRCPDCTTARGNPYGWDWQKLAARILERDDRICGLCGLPGATSVHHLRGVATYGTGLPDPDDLIAAHIACNSRAGSPI